MDDELFKKKLSEVANWRIPQTITGTASGDEKKSRKRGRPTKEEQYQNEHEKIFFEEFEGSNPTFPPQLVKIKKSACVCEDCGEYCPNGREKEAKLHKKKDKTVWRQHCLTCNRWQNPFNNKFELEGTKASIKFNDFLKETKGVYKTKGNERRAEVTINKDKTMIDNEAETITFYHDHSEIR